MAGDPTGRISHVPEMHRGVSWKQPCRVATTANITIATALNAGDSIDGVTLAAGDRVLVKDQSTGSQNGIYLAGVTPIRDFDMDQDGTTAVPAEEVLGAIVYVIAGTTNGGTTWRNTNTTAPTLGTTALTFAQISAGASFATPAIVLGTAAAAGSAATVIRSDATIVAFDATVPVTQAFSDTAATGSAAVAARRDHKHGMPASGGGGALTHAYLGYNTVGASFETLTSSRQYMKKITVSSAGMLQNVGLYMKMATTVDISRLLGIVMEDSSGVPAKLIAHGTGHNFGFKTGSLARWLHLPVPIYLTAADYWIGFSCATRGASDLSLAYDTGGSDPYMTTGDYAIDGNYTTNTDSTRTYSIRASILT